MYFSALKYPSPASSIVFQSAGMTNGKIVKNKVVEEESEWEDLETSHEEEDFMETDDDQDSIEKEGNNVKEVNLGFICFLPAWPWC